MSTDNIPHHANVYFMIYSNTTKVFIYYNPHTHKVKQIHHAYIDENEIWIHPKSYLPPVSLLIYGHNNVKYTPDLPSLSDIKPVNILIYSTNSAFDPYQVLNIDIELPPSWKYLSVSIMVYAIFNIP